MKAQISNPLNPGIDGAQEKINILQDIIKGKEEIISLLNQKVQSQKRLIDFFSRTNLQEKGGYSWS